MVSSNCADASPGNWLRLCRGVSGVPRGNDVAGRRLGIAPERTLEMDAAHRGLGCDRVCDLVVDVRTQQHKVAERRLQDSRGHARTHRPESCTESLPIKARGSPTPSWLLPPLRSQDPNAVPILRIFLACSSAGGGRFLARAS